VLHIHASDNSIEIERDGLVVHVDGSAGALLVRAPGGEAWEIGATRAGLGAICGLVEDALLVSRLTGDEARAIRDAVTGALRRAAQRLGLRDPPTERQIEAIWPTPLLFSAPYLSSSWLRDDARRFRPARLAIARLEDEESDDAWPEGAEALVSRLERWRDAFSLEGKARGALNKALTHHGEALPLEVLWGFRRVPDFRGGESRAHLEVVGWLGAHPRHARLHAQMALVQRASQSELSDALEQAKLANISPIGAPHALAEMMAHPKIADPGPSLANLVRYVIADRGDDMRPSDVCARPPIPLPSTPGLRFLATAGDLVEEGVRMEHCVATYWPWARTGEAYLFHVEHRQEHATVQVDEMGRPVQWRGPGNKDNAAARWGYWALHDWGRGFWAKRFGAATRTWRRGKEAPPGTTPLLTVEECLLLWRELVERRGHSDTFQAWFEEQVTQAALGEAWLVVQRLEGEVHLSVMNDKGRVVAHSNQLFARSAADGLRVVRAGV
jgi:hypothetical protein